MESETKQKTKELSELSKIRFSLGLLTSVNMLVAGVVIVTLASNYFQFIIGAVLLLFGWLSQVVLQRSLRNGKTA